MGALDDGERVFAPDAATWRAWLQQNHATSTGAWLVRARPGSDVEVVAYEDAILHALCFGWIDGPVRSFDERTGGLWFAPRRPSSGWAATNKARVILLEESGLMADPGRRAIERAKENGAWSVLDNAESLREPDDLAAALDAAPAARAAWDAFPPSARKIGIAAVDSARRPETRAARIAKVVTDAAAGRRP
ncbi:MULTISPECIES: YdeI/OmpD-associated family protein [unclassified Microbacterium]|uniref:YdeI/OmpD-associated family protein n=1 Tax=unclassified Microbacterium TaxID=2609290 RepID=UPI00214B0286|nr:MULTISPECIES: YdeI/OmpD-associated family protein [unclassified Microbacterium]MCR2808461.1 YdeI/OmpD-associated family protein [Microbacterium sp. zg.B185]WIM19096.1 YdeI/OmpD-associated family protein [Microbacterium sp. zg-B185]